MTAARLVALALAGLVLAGPGRAAADAGPAAPQVIGQTFTLPSAILGEDRVINVYRPAGARADSLPVLVMPDGGLGEDFLHVAGLVQIGAVNGTMRPFLLVGIENTERRRDLTGPTANEQDRTIAPRVGGSAAFRRFIADELLPEIRRRYRTTAETAIVGESLAGLFVVETLLLEPDLFDAYLAFDPSLWWDDGRLVREAAALLQARPGLRRTLFLASSDEPAIAAATAQLAGNLAAGAPPGLAWRHEPMPQESHRTIYHPAALRAFRAVLGPRQP